MGRTLILTILALLLVLFSAEHEALDCDECTAEFVATGGCAALQTGNPEEIIAKVPDNCRGNCADAITIACVPCPELSIRDCVDPSVCWPSGFQTDGVKDCGYSPTTYRADLSCHSFGASECPLPKGCDDVPGSGLVEDECGVCDGNGKSCSCDGGKCDVVLSVGEDDLTQTSATINHCSSDHWRGYQFTVKGATLVSWESAIHELTTQCSVSTGICLGFGYTDAYGYSAHHIAKNKHDDTDALSACNSPLVNIEFTPIASPGTLHLEDVLIGSDYDYLVGGARAPHVDLPRPDVRLFWGYVGYEHAQLLIYSDVTVTDMVVKLRYGEGFLLKGGDQYPLQLPAAFNCVVADDVSREAVCTFSNAGIGDIAPGYGGPAIRVGYGAVDGSRLDEATIEVIVDSITTETGSEVDYEVDVPETIKLPTVELQLDVHDLTTADVVIRAREDVRGCQFALRGVDLETSSANGFGQLHTKKAAGEEKFLTFSMAGETIDGDGEWSSLMSMTFAKQTIEQATLMLRDVRCANDRGQGQVGAKHMVTSSPREAHIARCDTKWDGMCDSEDFDNDGCNNIDDFAPEDDKAGCGACGDVSADGDIDILDIVMAVKHIVDGDFNTIVDTMTDEDNDLDDINMLKWWVLEPLGEYHPSLPVCDTGP